MKLILSIMEAEMENNDAMITVATLKEVGFVPGIIIIGGWLYALILALVIVYNLSLYAIRMLTYRKLKNDN